VFTWVNRGRTMHHRVAPLALVVAGLCAAPTLAAAQLLPSDGVYFTSAEFDQPSPGALAAAGRQGSRWFTLGSRVRPSRVVLSSEDNHNTRYALLVESPARGACGEGVVRLGTTTLVSDSYGGGGGACTLSFELTPAMATAAARALGVPRQDRRPAGDHVVGTFGATQAVYRRGQPVEIVLTLANPVGAPRTQRHYGGRQRGPRDNQFSFTITRNGRPVEPLLGYDFGGRSTYAPLDPGGQVEIRAPLDRWGNLAARGHYVVQCRYETEFSPDGSHPSEDHQRGAVWDRVFQGTVTFDVR
jgi:hypothetical protein